MRRLLPAAAAAFVLSPSVAAEPLRPADVAVCPWVDDGECDEPGIGTSLCAPSTDAGDCRGLELTPANDPFFGRDDRIVMTPDAMPWTAIGKLVLPDGHCTGALVGPRVVLTAAHCLFDQEGARLDAGRFSAGYHDGAYVAQSEVASHWIPPDYDYGRFSDASGMDGLDYAFLLLVSPIGSETGWFDLAAEADVAGVAGGTAGVLVQAGYSGDTEEFLTAHLGCPVLGLDHLEPNTIRHECDTLVGDSGSPLFVEAEGVYRIVAIESSTYGDDVPVNIAVDVRAFADDLRRFVAQHDRR